MIYETSTGSLNGMDVVFCYYAGPCMPLVWHLERSGEIVLDCGEDESGRTWIAIQRTPNM